MAERLYRGAVTDGDDSGLALLAVVVVLALLMAIAASSVSVSIRESRVALATSAAAPGLYAAESGLAVARASWDPERLAGAPPGLPIAMSHGTLASGDGYDARAARLSPRGEDGGALHLLVSVGTVRSPRGGGRRVARLLRTPEPARWCCKAALTSPGDVEVSGNATVSGSDTGLVPGLDCLPGGAGPRAGVMIGDAGNLEVAPGSHVDGRPPVLSVGEELELLLAEVRSAFSELAGRADVVLPPGARLDRLGPVLDSAGDCDRELRENWGEPRDPTHPCAAYLPVVYAAGDLTLGTDGRGQGILLVGGDLTVEGEVEFRGLVLVRGDVWWKGGRGSGAVLQLDDEGARFRVGEGGVLRLSECAVERALGSAKLVSPHPLAQFSWLEILEEG